LGRIIFRKLSPRSHRLHAFGMRVEGVLLYIFQLLVRWLKGACKRSGGIKDRLLTEYPFVHRKHPL
jgi:hypothetical protein